MKKLFVLGVAASAFAGANAATLLSDSELDNVTAGTASKTFSSINTATVVQVNASPVTVAQINALTKKGATNYAAIYSGNWADLKLIIK